jgi:hypothetical protein
MSARRVLVVTLILVVMGALSGAILGAVLGFVVGTVRYALAVEGTAGFVGAYSALGAALGGGLAPVTGWLLLRHVPLGRAMGITLLGTMTGATIGVFLLHDIWWLWAALIGYALAAIYLRLTTRAASTPPESGPDPDIAT